MGDWRGYAIKQNLTIKILTKQHRRDADSEGINNWHCNFIVVKIYIYIYIYICLKDLCRLIHIYVIENAYRVRFYKQVYTWNDPVSKPTTVSIFPLVMLTCSRKHPTFPSFETLVEYLQALFLSSPITSYLKKVV